MKITTINYLIDQSTLNNNMYGRFINYTVFHFSNDILNNTKPIILYLYIKDCTTPEEIDGFLSDNNVVGTASIYVPESDEEMAVYDEYHWIGNLFVKENYRRLYIGTALLRKAISLGANALNVDVKNIPAIRMYTASGFRIDSEYESMKIKDGVGDKSSVRNYYQMYLKY